MTVPMMPYGFRDGGALDVDSVNGNLIAGARDVANNLAQRYTYSRAIFDLSGIVDTDAAVRRQIPIRRPGGSNAVEIVGVELSINGTASVKWTLSSTTDTHWPSISLTTTGGTTEDQATSDIPTTVASSASDAVFEIDASTSAGNVITSGFVVIHFRCDRGNQGASFGGYTPSLITSSDNTTGGRVDGELTALAAAVTRDGAAATDISVECFIARGIGAGNTLTWHLPGGARAKLAAVGYVAAQTAAGGNQVVFSVDGQNLTVTGNGATTRNVATLALTGASGSDPTNPASDTAVSIAVAGATCGLAVLWVFWS